MPSPRKTTRNHKIVKLNSQGELNNAQIGRIFGITRQRVFRILELSPFPSKESVDEAKSD